MSEPKLKPCPFCGGLAELYRGVDLNLYAWVRCLKLKCAIAGPWRRSDKEAIAAWNRRVEMSEKYSTEELVHRITIHDQLAKSVEDAIIAKLRAADAADAADAAARAAALAAAHAAASAAARENVKEKCHIFVLKRLRSQ